MDWYLLIDGDRVGDQLDKAAANNDLHQLLFTSAAIDTERSQIADHAIAEGGSVLLANSDTLLIRSDRPFHWSLTDLTTENFTWSAGQGRSLALAHAALAVAKVRGVGLLVTFVGEEQLVNGVARSESNQLPRPGFR